METRTEEIGSFFAMRAKTSADTSGSNVRVRMRLPFLAYGQRIGAMLKSNEDLCLRGVRRTDLRVRKPARLFQKPVRHETCRKWTIL